MPLATPGRASSGWSWNELKVRCLSLCRAGLGIDKRWTGECVTSLRNEAERFGGHWAELSAGSVVLLVSEWQLAAPHCRSEITIPVHFRIVAPQCPCNDYYVPSVLLPCKPPKAVVGYLICPFNTSNYQESTALTRRFEAFLTIYDRIVASPRIGGRSNSLSRRSDGVDLRH